MSLSRSALHSVGQLVYFHPRYGWGWWGHRGTADCLPFDYSVLDAGGTFAIRVERFFWSLGRARGLIGRVEQPRHVFDDQWIVTWTMSAGTFDLMQNLCPRWDSELGLEEPIEEEFPAIPDAFKSYSGCGGVVTLTPDPVARVP